MDGAAYSCYVVGDGYYGSVSHLVGQSKTYDDALFSSAPLPNLSETGGRDLSNRREYLCVKSAPAKEFGSNPTVIAEWFMIYVSISDVFHGEQHPEARRAMLAFATFVLR